MYEANHTVISATVVLYKDENNVFHTNVDTLMTTTFSYKPEAHLAHLFSRHSSKRKKKTR